MCAYFGLPYHRNAYDLLAGDFLHIVLLGAGDGRGFFVLFFCGRTSVRSNRHQRRARSRPLAAAAAAAAAAGCRLGPHHNTTCGSS